jgi:hypothetical protein
MIQNVKTEPFAAATPNAVTFSSVLNALAKSKTVRMKAEKCSSILKAVIDLHKNNASHDTKPNVICYNTVLNVCAFLAQGSEAEQRQALAVAVETFNQMRQGKYVSPDAVSYGNMLKAFANLMPTGEQRSAIAARLFASCCDTGSVGGMCLDKIRQCVPPRAFLPLLAGCGYAVSIAVASATMSLLPILVDCCLCPQPLLLPPLSSPPTVVAVTVSAATTIAAIVAAIVTAAVVAATAINSAAPATATTAAVIPTAVVAVVAVFAAAVAAATATIVTATAVIATAAVVTATAAVTTAAVATAAVATAAIVIATATVTTAAIARRCRHHHSSCHNCRSCHCRHCHRHRHRHHPFHLCHRVGGQEALQGEIMQGGFGGEMTCGWRDVRYRFSIPTSPKYINRIFLYLMQKNHLEGFRLSHWHTLAVA